MKMDRSEEDREKGKRTKNRVADPQRDIQKRVLRLYFLKVTAWGSLMSLASSWFHIEPEPELHCRRD